MNRSRLYVTNPQCGAVEQPISGDGTVEELWTNVVGAPSLVGGPRRFPGRTGADPAPFDVGPRRWSVGLSISGPDATDDVDATQQLLGELRAVGRLVWSPRAPLTLLRELDVAVDGRPRLVRHIAEAQLVDDGMSPVVDNPVNVRCVLGFTLLPGYWRDELPSTIDLASGAPATIDVDSDGHTDWVEVTFTGGTNPAIANAATGKTLTYTGTPASAALDCRAFTATDGGVDVRSRVTSDDVTWLELAPGQNQLTLTGGGTATVAWRGVHL